MAKKKRKIRWDRVAILAAVSCSTIFIVTVGIFKIIDIQEQNRKKVNVELIVDGSTYNLNGDQFINYKTTGELPLVYELTQEELENDLARQEYSAQHVEDDSEHELTNLGVFKLTAYCNCEKCCGQWAGGPCYNGEMPEAEWTIAVDPDVIPVNSYVMINGHKYKACDTGNAIIGNRIDIYCNTHEECFNEDYNGEAEVYLINE